MPVPAGPSRACLPAAVVSRAPRSGAALRRHRHWSEIDPPSQRVDALDPDLERVPEAERGSGDRPAQLVAVRVVLEPLGAEPVDADEPLGDPAVELDEQPESLAPGDEPRERLPFPAAQEPDLLPLEDLALGGLGLPLEQRARLRELREVAVARARAVPRRTQRAMGDEVRVPADRRGEVEVVIG